MVILLIFERKSLVFTFAGNNRFLKRALSIIFHESNRAHVYLSQLEKIEINLLNRNDKIRKKE